MSCKISSGNNIEWSAIILRIETIENKTPDINTGRKTDDYHQELATESRTVLEGDGSEIAPNNTLVSRVTMPISDNCLIPINCGLTADERFL